ncbi:MAG: DUF4417 domain-containing protein [Ezakiella sp.]|nr:DUF4417 domain-containing protein [Ezakiella sp.]
MAKWLKRHPNNLRLCAEVTFNGDLPYIPPLIIDDLPTKWIGFNEVKSFRGDKSSTGVHFFIDDYQFERIWKSPLRYLDMLKDFKLVTSPDFSLYEDMPYAMQLWNLYRGLLVGALWSEYGLMVVPSVSWSSKLNDFGIYGRGVVAVSSVGVLKDVDKRDIFVDGFKKMIEELDPIKILFFGVVPCGVDCNRIINCERSFYEY